MTELVVTERFAGHPEDSHTIERVLATGGYRGLRAALQRLTPDQVLERVKASGLRGRGGAGFPTGMKWSFIPKDLFPRYVVVNDDEGEPGTFKDRELTERDPHAIVEGALIAAYAIRAERVYVYVRGEFALGTARLERAIGEAAEHGLLGNRIAGSDFDCEVVVHRGAGAYICGEETALLDSLEGYRGQPRLRPPFPAVKGLYGSPTIVNNVETLANLPHIVLNGPDWFRRVGTEKSPGTKVYSVSGHVERPGNYEFPLGTSLAQILEAAGGMRGGRKLKAVIPGGASAPWLTTTDVAMDFESLQAAGSMLGSGGVVFMDETTCAVGAALAIARFFNHESCGKCTPCREGTWWMVKVLERLERAEGRPEDPGLLLDLCGRMLPEAGAPASGRSFCPLGDSAAWSLRSSLELFADEFRAHAAGGRCPLNPATPRRRRHAPWGAVAASGHAGASG